MKKIIVFIIIALLIIGVGSCGSNSGNSYDDAMASYDWGPNHYYDRNSHQVERKAWK